MTQETEMYTRARNWKALIATVNILCLNLWAMVYHCHCLQHIPGIKSLTHKSTGAWWGARGGIGSVEKNSTGWPSLLPCPRQNFLINH